MGKGRIKISYPTVLKKGITLTRFDFAHRESLWTGFSSPVLFRLGMLLKICAIIRHVSAEEGTRTPTPLRAHVPETCVSTNFTTSAGGR